MQRGLAAYSDAYAAVMLYMTRELRVRPAEVNGALRDFHATAIQVMQTHRSGSAVGMLRVSIIQPHGATSFRVTHAYNMATDPDDGILFSHLLKGAPAAFGSREPA